MRAQAIPADALAEWVPKIGDELQSFADCGEWYAEDFISQLYSEDRQLWLAINDDEEIKGVVLTSIAADRRNTLHITHGSGTGFREWVYLATYIFDWGRDMGCKTVEVTCRPGWERFLKNLGLRKTHVVMEACLDGQ